MLFVVGITFVGRNYFFPPRAVRHTDRTFEAATKPIKGTLKYGQLFNDINKTQLTAARRLGITPQKTRDGFQSFIDQGHLVRVESTQYYAIAPLTHSVPYLVPEAADFLAVLGQRMQELGDGTSVRFIITSLLRSKADEAELKKVNENAVFESAHYYGTTFDIAYNNFDYRWHLHRPKRYKEFLARALYDMQQAGHCYVRHEEKQKCFHITVRPNPKK